MDKQIEEKFKNNEMKKLIFNEYGEFVTSLKGCFVGEYFSLFVIDNLFI